MCKFKNPVSVDEIYIRLQLLHTTFYFLIPVAVRNCVHRGRCPFHVFGPREHRRDHVEPKNVLAPSLLIDQLP